MEKVSRAQAIGSVIYADFKANQSAKGWVELNTLRVALIKQIAGAEMKFSFRETFRSQSFEKLFVLITQKVSTQKNPSFVCSAAVTLLILINNVSAEKL